MLWALLLRGKREGCFVLFWSNLKEKIMIFSSEIFYFEKFILFFLQETKINVMYKHLSFFSTLRLFEIVFGAFLMDLMMRLGFRSWLKKGNE